MQWPIQRDAVAILHASLIARARSSAARCSSSATVYSWSVDARLPAQFSALAATAGAELFNPDSRIVARLRDVPARGPERLEGDCHPKGGLELMSVVEPA